MPQNCGVSKKPETFLKFGNIFTGNMAMKNNFNHYLIVKYYKCEKHASPPGLEPGSTLFNYNTYLF